MRKFEDWCRFYAEIETDPRKIISDLTIGDYLQAAQHLNDCPKCEASSERVLRDAPPEDPMNKIGFN